MRWLVDQTQNLNCCSDVTDEFDPVVESESHQVTDPSTVATLAARWAAVRWLPKVDDTGQALTAGYSAPSPGRPHWVVYRLVARTATAMGVVEPGGATRWSF